MTGWSLPRIHWPVCSHWWLLHTGHGSSRHRVEGWSRAGVFGHHTGAVDSPARVAALRRPDAPWAGRLRLVNTEDGSHALVMGISSGSKLVLGHVNLACEGVLNKHQWFLRTRTKHARQLKQYFIFQWEYFFFFCIIPNFHQSNQVKTVPCTRCRKRLYTKVICI